jgi:plastocyanin domain-containing protein
MFALRSIDWLVIVAGAALIAWVLWYFFLAERGATSAEARAGGVQEVTIVVEGGYEPATVRVKAGAPVRLHFDRRETNGCSEELVIPDFGIRTFLPANRTTDIEITPAKPGTYEFTCGMGMLRGRVVAA